MEIKEKTSRHEWERQYRKENRGVGSMEQNITPSANRKIVKQESENGKKYGKTGQTTDG